MKTISTNQWIYYLLDSIRALAAAAQALAIAYLMFQIAERLQ